MRVEMKRLATSVAALVLCSAALAASLYECYPTEPEQGEMVVCPMEGLEQPYSGEFGWIIHDELGMVGDQPTVVWHGVHVLEAGRPSPDRVAGKLGEFIERLLDELRDGFGKIESGEVDIEKNESLKRLVDEFREETGIEIVRVEIE
ncbi:MAG: hypothetical protein OXH85_04385 [Truepera sp.]|nr:hypothetical protein [Truepera sp.]